MGLELWYMDIVDTCEIRRERCNEETQKLHRRDFHMLLNYVCSIIHTHSLSLLYLKATFQPFNHIHPGSLWPPSPCVSGQSPDGSTSQDWPSELFSFSPLVLFSSFFSTHVLYIKLISFFHCFFFTHVSNPWLTTLIFFLPMLWSLNWSTICWIHVFTTSFFGQPQNILLSISLSFRLSRPPASLENLSTDQWSMPGLFFPLLFLYVLYWTSISTSLISWHWFTLILSYSLPTLSDS